MLVCGTGTEVGKTWVACALARQLRESGVKVAARKPAQSYDGASGVDVVTDADLLATATGDRVEEVCPPERTYAVAMAPPMAADALGRPALRMRDLVASLDWDDGVDVGIVESAGGVRSPLAEDGDTIDYARGVQPDLVVLVADAGLGTINAVRAVAPALGEWPLLVLLNRFDVGDELHARNRDWLGEREGMSVLTDQMELARRVLGRSW